MWEKCFQNNQDFFNLKNMKRVKEILLTSTKIRSKEKMFSILIEDSTDDNILSFEKLLETKIQNETHSEPTIDILTT